MTMVTVDTHAFYKRLTKVGMDEGLAEVVIYEWVALVNAILNDAGAVDAEGGVKRLTEAGMPARQAEVLINGWVEQLRAER